jgi:zinc transport system substrate-binding protein
MKRKGIVYLVLLMIFAFSVSACTDEGQVRVDENGAGEPEALEEADEKISVVATLFPQYDFARRIGGENVDVRYLLPPGTEAHSYEPTPQDMVSLLNADVFLHTGEFMEPWTANIVENLKEENVLVVDLSQNIPLLTADDHEHEEGDDHGEEEAIDPHYWTDPNMAMIMAKSIGDALARVDPDNADQYKVEEAALVEDLILLDNEIREALSRTKSKTILSGSHFAFGYFARQYGLEHMSPYAGFSPNAEPTPQRITALIQTIEETGANAIYHEELIDPKVAQVIVDETGAKLLLLHGAHNVSKEELESGKTYIEIMYDNLENLKEGLGYE